MAKERQTGKRRRKGKGEVGERKTRDLPGNGARNPSCYLLSMRWFSLEEERVMQQSSADNRVCSNGESPDEVCCNDGVSDDICFDWAVALSRGCCDDEVLQLGWQLATSDSRPRMTWIMVCAVSDKNSTRDSVYEFAAQAAALSSGPQLAALVLEATSHPALFAFSELLTLPALSKLTGTQYASSLDLLRLFAYGTLKDYKSNSSALPALLPDQARKLKQLSVLTLAESTKVLPYDQLMQELDVSNVRELEDFLINECMYSGIVRGKLDQLRRCFEVQFAAGRDLTPDQLTNMIETLSDWLGTSDNLLHQIQEKIKWADTTSELNKKHQKEFEDRVEEAKKSVKQLILLNSGIAGPFSYLIAEVEQCKQADNDLRGHDDFLSESGGIMDFEEDRIRPKRRRQPMA
uniref:Uncharacterized protein n=1 Tax=Aegilops tauschii TaxID=37682 RepID=R7WAG1_AEGTA